MMPIRGSNMGSVVTYRVGLPMCCRVFYLSEHALSETEKMTSNQEMSNMTRTTLSCHQKKNNLISTRFSKREQRNYSDDTVVTYRFLGHILLKQNMNQSQM